MCGGAGASTSIGGFAFDERHDDLARQQLQRDIGALAVDRIAEDRPALRSAMDPQLMRAPCPRLKLKPGDRARLARPRAPSPARASAPVARSDRPSSTSRARSSSRPSGRSIAPLSASGRAGDDRPIGLGDLALLEQEPQFLQRLMMSPEHEAAGGVAVEPVCERRLSRQSEPQRVEIVLEAQAAFRAPHGRRRPPAYRERASARRDKAAALLFLPASWGQWYSNTAAPRIGRRRRGFLGWTSTTTRKRNPASCAAGSAARTWRPRRRPNGRRPRLRAKPSPRPPPPPRKTSRRPLRNREEVGLSAFGRASRARHRT